jgi:two-component system response regulator FlrC
MQRAIVLSADAVVDTEQLIFDEFSGGRTAAAAQASVVPVTTSAANNGAVPPVSALPESGADLDAAVRISEHRAIAAALRAAPSRAEAARALGISPRTLRYKLAQLKGYGLGVGTAEMVSS